jgi:hypothetical protein
MNRMRTHLPLWWAGLAALALWAVAPRVEAQPVKLGAGTYFLAPKAGDKAVPSAPFRTEAMLKRAAPTNQWYSTLVFSAKPEALFVQPITVKTTPAGLEFALPSKEAVTSVRQDVEIRYPHAAPLLIAPAAFAPASGRRFTSPATASANRPARAAPAAAMISACNSGNTTTSRRESPISRISERSRCLRSTLA